MNSHIKTVMVVTTNLHKREKLKDILRKHFPNVLFLNEKLVESKDTLIGNAKEKAITISKRFPEHIVVATDGGMEIPGLLDWNPVLTNRFLGDGNISDQDRIDAFLNKVESQYIQNRTMRWREAIAIATNGEVLISEEVVGAEGEIQDKSEIVGYREGIWLCSLWYFPKFGKNFFELSDEEKKYAEISWEKIALIIDKFAKSLL